MWRISRKRTFVLGLILVAAALALLVGLSVPAHAVPMKQSQAANQLSSAPSTGVSQSTSAPHQYVGPCRRCVAAHPYEAKVLGIGSLAG